LLDSAVKVTEKFVEKGKMIVYTKGRQPGQNIEFISSCSNPNLNLPLVVLINDGSASGSEIVAGALQDYKRAIILGTKSFGKGSVQTVIPLGDGSALRLTTSKYFTPLGKVIHNKGVVPDIEIEAERTVAGPEEKKVNDADDVFEEVENKDKPKSELSFDYKKDSQLMRSIDILKAAVFYQDAKK